MNWGGWLTLGGILGALAIFTHLGDDSSQAGVVTQAGRSLVITADESNACHTEITIHGHRFRMLLDSGATGVGLVFGSNQAAALGFSPKALLYSQTYSSANGDGREAAVRLHDVRLREWRLGDVDAVITRAPQDEGLVGADLLHRLEFRATDRACILTMAGLERDPAMAKLARQSRQHASAGGLP
jgi:clan AA aspartic protease (TIGR02281 family)